MSSPSRSSAPRRLSTVPSSPHYDRAACGRVLAVYVDDVLVPECVAYDMDAGWAFSRIGGVWQPKIYGRVRVTLREQG